MKMMVKKYLMFSLISIVMVFSACQRLELYELTSEVNLDLRIDLTINMNLDMVIDEQIDKDFEEKIKGKMPEYMEVLFYDVQSKQLKYSSIIPSTGGRIRVSPGDYDIVAYSFGTESTQIDNLENKNTAEAFTTNITKMMASKFKAAVENAPKDDGAETKTDTKGYEDDPIIYEPDHLYVARVEEVNVPSFEGRDESIVIQSTASTIVDVYSLEVLGMSGCENIEKVEAFITGQHKSNFFGELLRSIDPATLYVTMKVDATNGRLYTVFGTFGRMFDSNNKVYLDITVTNTGGGQYRYVYDVTDQFEDDTDNSLIIYDDIDIPAGASGGGGLAPEVDDWEEENYDIPLM